MSPIAPEDPETSERSGAAAPLLASWLGLAAAPTFALMALWSAMFGGASDPICTAASGATPISGMTMMYALMGAFHLAPWLRLWSRQPSRVARI
jgi:hypothetical protein